MNFYDYFNSIVQISPLGLSFLFACFLLQKLSNIKRENSVEPPYIYPLDVTITLLTFCHANSLGFFPSFMSLLVAGSFEIQITKGCGSKWFDNNVSLQLTE